MPQKKKLQPAPPEDAMAWFLRHSRTWDNPKTTPKPPMLLQGRTKPPSPASTPILTLQERLGKKYDFSQVPAKPPTKRQIDPPGSSTLMMDPSEKLTQQAVDSLGGMTGTVGGRFGPGQDEVSYIMKVLKDAMRNLPEGRGVAAEEALSARMLGNVDVKTPDDVVQLLHGNDVVTGAQRILGETGERVLDPAMGKHDTSGSALKGVLDDIASPWLQRLLKKPSGGR